MDTLRVLFDSEGPRKEPILQSLAFTKELCSQSKKPLKVVLVVPAKKYFDHGVFSGIFPRDYIRMLTKGISLTLPNTSTLSLDSVKTYNPYEPKDIVLGVHISRKDIENIEKTRNIFCIIIVPWIKDDIIEWKNTWNPRMIGSSGSIEDEYQVNLPLVVERGLKSLTTRINLSTGLTHPSDYASAVELLKIMYKGGYQFNPSDIKITLMPTIV